MGEDKETPKEKEKKEDKDDKKEEIKESKDKKNEDKKEEKGKKDDEKDSKKGSRKKLQKGMIVKTVKNAFKIEKILGSGAFGDVYKVSLLDKPSDFFALKTEYDDKKKQFNRLKSELAVLEEINHRMPKCKYFAKLEDKGVAQHFRFTVMELISLSLHFIQKDIAKGPMPDFSAMFLIKETLKAISILHEMGFVHRDIKPHNFAVGIAPNERQVYMIDFGIARRVTDAKGILLVPRTKVPFLGSLKYASRGCHQERDQSMRDDLECWAYMCLEFYGDLPWHKLKSRDEILKQKTALFVSAKEGQGPWGPTRTFYADVMKEIDKMSFTDDVGKTKIPILVEDAMKDVMRDTKSTPTTPLIWEGKAIPDSRPRRKTAANRVQNDEDSSERRKREEKEKKKEEKMAKIKKIEEELAKVMKEIEEGNQPEERKEEARRIYRDEMRRESDRKKRRSGGTRRRRYVEEDSDDYDDDSDEDDSYEDERARRRERSLKRSRYREDEPRRRRTKRTQRDYDTPYEDRKERIRRSKGTKRSGGGKGTVRRTRHDGLSVEPDSPPKEGRKDSRGRKEEKSPSPSAEKIEEMEGEKRKDSGKRKKPSPNHSSEKIEETPKEPRKDSRGRKEEKNPSAEKIEEMEGEKRKGSGKRKKPSPNPSAEKIEEDGEHRKDSGKKRKDRVEGSKDKMTPESSPAATPINLSDKARKK